MTDGLNMIRRTLTSEELAKRRADSKARFSGASSISSSQDTVLKNIGEILWTGVNDMEHMILAEELNILNINIHKRRIFGDRLGPSISVKVALELYHLHQNEEILKQHLSTIRLPSYFESKVLYINQVLARHDMMNNRTLREALDWWIDFKASKLTKIGYNNIAREINILLEKGDLSPEKLTRIEELVKACFICYM